MIQRSGHPAELPWLECRRPCCNQARVRLGLGRGDGLLRNILAARRSSNDCSDTGVPSSVGGRRTKNRRVAAHTLDVWIVVDTRVQFARLVASVSKGIAGETDTVEELRRVAEHI